MLKSVYKAQFPEAYNKTQYMLPITIIVVIVLA